MTITARSIGQTKQSGLLGDGTGDRRQGIGDTHVRSVAPRVTRRHVRDILIDALTRLFWWV